MKSKFAWLRAKNFRSHKDTYVEFGNFTVILGETDSGKSAMLGSIKWCLFNDPSGDKFIRNEYEVDDNGIAILDDNGQTIKKESLTCDVELAFDNGRSIRHVKAPNDHFYELKENGEIVLTLRNFGTGPVKEVMNFHGMHRVDFFGEKQVLNFCPQMDKPFFLGESGPTRATMVGKLAHTDAIDLAIKNTDSELRTARKKAKEKKADLKTAIDKLKLYKNLAKMEKDIDKIDKYMKKAEEANDKYNAINGHIIKLRELNVQKAQLELIIAHEIEIDRVVSIIDTVSMLMVKSNSIIKINNLRINNLNQKLQLQNLASLDEGKLNSVVETCDNSVALIKKRDILVKANANLERQKADLLEISKIANIDIDIDKILSMLDNCLTNIKLHSSISVAHDKLKKQINRKVDGLEVISGLENSFDFKFNKYKEALKNFSKCPTCMGDITEERIDGLQDII